MTNSPEMRALEPATAWLIERRGFDTLAAPNTYAVHWYAQDDATGWHWWMPIAFYAKRFGSKSEAEAFPPYQMIARDPSISITEHVFLSAPHAQGDVAGLVEAIREERRAYIIDDYDHMALVDAFNKGLDTAIAALPHSDGAVAGWKHVPTEPNNDMIVAGEKQRPGSVVRVRDVYRAMLAAAPVSPINPVPAGVGYRYRIKTTEFPKWSGWADADSDPHDWLWLDNWTDMQVEETILRQAPDAEQGAVWTPEKYAEQLAISLREKHYPEVPQFEPMTGDIMGLLSQIDNMMTGLMRAPTQDKP